MKRLSNVLLWIAAALSVGVPALREWLELSMARHMLIEFPLLLAAGAAAAASITPRMHARVAPFDYLGLTGLTWFSLTLAYWMIPAALDAALAHGALAVTKYASLLAAGCALRISLAHAPIAMQAFFIGNCVWMTATVGLLYQELPQQLCLFYLQDAQVRAGEGLVGVAVIGGVVWCVAALRANTTRHAQATPGR